MDILMNQLRMRLVWKENEGSGADYVPTGDTFNTTTFANWNVSNRDLCLKVLIQKAIYPANEDPYYEYTMLDDDKIVSYTVNEGGTDGFALGSVIASSYTLVVDNSGHEYTASTFTNTRIAVAIGIKISGHAGIDYEPLGVWSVTDVDAAEQSSVVTIQGMDMLGFYYDDVFFPFTGDDAAIQIDYGSISGMLDQIIQIWSDIPLGLMIDDNGWVISDQPDTPLFNWRLNMDIWSTQEQTEVNNYLDTEPTEVMYVLCSKKGVTRRQIISWCAEPIAGFVRIARDGTLEIRRYLDHRTIPSMYRNTVTPATYYTYTPDGVEGFKFNRAIAYYYTDDTGENTAQCMYGAYNDSIPALPSNTVQISANPFIDIYYGSELRSYFRDGLEDDMYGLNEGYHESASVSFVGAPQIIEGQTLKVTDKDGNDHLVTFTRVSITYDGGFSMTSESKIPSDNTAYSSSFNSSTTLLTYTKELAYGRANQAAYSTDEQVTGQRWIDGKPIYRIVMKRTLTLAANTAFGTMPAYETIVSCNCIVSFGTNTKPIPFSYYNNNNWELNWTIQDDSDIVIQAGSSHRISGTVHFIIEYTKPTN